MGKKSLLSGIQIYTIVNDCMQLFSYVHVCALLVHYTPNVIFRGSAHSHCAGWTDNGLSISGWTDIGLSASGWTAIGLSASGWTAIGLSVSGWTDIGLSVYTHLLFTYSSGLYFFGGGSRIIILCGQ